LGYNEDKIEEMTKPIKKDGIFVFLKEE